MQREEVDFHQEGEGTWDVVTGGTVIRETSGSERICLRGGVGAKIGERENDLMVGIGGYHLQVGIVLDLRYREIPEIQEIRGTSSSEMA